MSEIKEEWKSIEGYDGAYEVSNYGKIRSLDRYISGPFDSKRFIKGVEIKSCLTGSGYLGFNLVKDGKSKTSKVHRVVANAFIENEHNKPEVNHKDGNKHNNHVSNLEWVTKGENQSHAYKSGLRCSKGINNPSSKLNESNVKNILKLLNRGVTAKRIAKAICVAESTIGRIKNGQKWNHITNGVKRQAV